MAFCRNCGSPLEEKVKFCANCGSVVDGADAAARNADHTADYDAVDISETKYLSLFCYFGILFMIFALVAKPHSQFVRFHANQGLVLMILMVAAGIVMIIPVLGWIAGAVAYIFCIVCMIIGIVNSCKGQAKELPLIGRICIFRFRLF